MNDDKKMMRDGSALWEVSYGQGGNEADLVSALMDLREMEPVDMGQLFNLFLAGKWAQHGFSKIVISHTYAAALAATSIDSELVQEVRLPWDTFLIVVPEGLLTVEDRKYDRLAIGRLDDKGDTLTFAPGMAKDVSFFFFMYESQARGVTNKGQVKRATTGLFSADLLSLLYSDEDRNIFAPDGQDVLDWDGKKRALRIARRLVVGVLYSLNFTKDFSIQTRPGAEGSSKRDGDPAHRIVTVGRPLKFDARPAVRDFIRGKGSTPTVQVMVRGHYQRYGTAKNWKWKEPHWRGPEDGLIQAGTKVL